MGHWLLRWRGLSEALKSLVLVQWLGPKLLDWVDCLELLLVNLLVGLELDGLDTVEYATVSSQGSSDNTDSNTPDTVANHSLMDTVADRNSNLPEFNHKLTRPSPIACFLKAFHFLMIKVDYDEIDCNYCKSGPKSSYWLISKSFRLPRPPSTMAAAVLLHFGPPIFSMKKTYLHLVLLPAS
jgi:hypothetical protein